MNSYQWSRYISVFITLVATTAVLGGLTKFKFMVGFVRWSVHSVDIHSSYDTPGSVFRSRASKDECDFLCNSGCLFRVSSTFGLPD